jgi:hypothetical protein
MTDNNFIINYVFLNYVCSVINDLYHSGNYMYHLVKVHANSANIIHIKRRLFS